MTGLYLSRARLSAGFDALGPILFPNDPAHKMAISHRLVWTLFPPDCKERPFLYREMSPSHARGRAARGEIYILSSMKPEDRKGLFDLQTQDFRPRLRQGELLQFRLRANPTAQRSEWVGGRRKNRRHDVVMQALRSLPQGERAGARPAIIRRAGLEWLTRQGERAGFSLPRPEALNIDGYEQFDADPEKRRALQPGGRRPGHSRIDFEGALRVEDPDLFVKRLGEGFGRARAFGHGLMLIKRA
jgi:CRISPR system Cascade subunit CasE